MSLHSSSALARRLWFGYAATVLVIMGIFLLLPAGSLAQNALYDVVAVSAAIVILVGIWIHRPAHPWPWVLMAAGQLAFFAGDLLWVIYAELGLETFPSLADVFYLAGYPLIAAGLIVGIRIRLGGGDRSSLLDAAILTTSVAVLAWTFQMGPLAAELDPKPLGLGISLAYPAMDVLLIGVCIGLLAAPGLRTTAFRLLALSLVALFVSDQIYALQINAESYAEGGFLDLGWLLAYGTIGAAALHPSMRSIFLPRPVTMSLLGPVRMAFLAVAMLTGPALLAFARSDADLGLAVIGAGSAVLSVLVLGRLAGLVRLLSADIDKRRVLEAELSFQASHDPLTHLANRRLFVQRVEERLVHPASSPLVVLFLDLDDFKTVNDSLGHVAGDELLGVVGQRIRSCLRESDLAARLGGDEFGVLLGDIGNAGQAEAIASRIAQALDAPLTIDGIVVPVAASIGIAIHTPDMDGVDALLRAADVAMYGAKARGKHRYKVYAPDQDPGDDRLPADRATTRHPRAADAVAGGPRAVTLLSPEGA